MSRDIDEVEVVEVRLKQSEYEERIVRLVRALLEIDELMNRQHDKPVSEKKAA